MSDPVDLKTKLLNGIPREEVLSRKSSVPVRKSGRKLASRVRTSASEKFLSDVNAHKVLNALSSAAGFRTLALEPNLSWDRVVKKLTVELGVDDLGRRMGFSDMDDAQKEIRRAVLVLFTKVLEFDAADQGKSARFKGTRFSVLDGISIKDGKILAVFSPLFVKSIMAAQDTFYPEALFGLHEDAYRVGWKLVRLAFREYFEREGGDDFYRMQVRTLVDVAGLPDYTLVSRDPVSADAWVTHAKDPLEGALNEVQASGLIRGWRYAQPGSQASYQDWSASIIEYTAAEGKPAKVADCGLQIAFA